MKAGRGPAAVIPPFLEKENLFSKRATVPDLRYGKAAKKEGEPEDLPACCSILRPEEADRDL